MDKTSNFDQTFKTTWCPGCGNFNILEALKGALTEEGLSPSEVLVVSGIGQAAKLPHYMACHGLNTLHGRAVPAAFGAHVANPSLKVILTSGDGDTYGEGGNHIIHGIRRNFDMVHMVHDNQVYGLTKGQGSPTTAFGQVTRLQFDGVKSDALNPIAFALGVGCGFVARSFSGDMAHLKELIKAAMAYEGYALIDILQPCVSFNAVNTYKWYKDRVYKLDDTYDASDKVGAFKKALEFGDEGIPLGIIYQESKTPYLKRLKHLDKGLIEFDRDPGVIAEIMRKMK